MEIYDTIVIGGGQAGLAAGYHLQRAGLHFVILEANHEPTGSWRHYYDSLKLFSPARYSSLPGLPFPGDPERYPQRDEVIAYLRSYAEYFQLPILTNAVVEQVERYNTIFHVSTVEHGQFATRSVIAATGAFSRPYFPLFDGQSSFGGAVLHSAAYRTPQPFNGQRVLVIGAGNSAVQIASELATTARVTLTSREPVRFRSQHIWGRDIHFWMRITGFDRWPHQLPRWNPVANKQQAVLDAGIYQAALRSGNPAYHELFTRFTERGIQWADGTETAFDSVIFATGFRPNLAYLEPVEALDAHGSAIHKDGVSTVTPGVCFVGISGQRSFSSATLRGVGADAAYVVRDLRRYLKSLQPRAERCCFTSHHSQPQTASQ
jgi:putative flavoprotein involved in K+ transport